MRRGNHRRARGRLTWLRVVGLVAVIAVAAVAGTAAWAEITETEEELPASSGAVRPPTPAPTWVAPSRSETHPAPARPSPRPGEANLYRFTGARDMSPRVRGVPARVYVPDNVTDTVTVIDPKSFRVVRRFPVGNYPQHITPSWDLRRLYVENSGENSLTVIDPRTSRPVKTIRGISAPYNLYFTPDGTKAIDVVEYQNRLEFRNPHTWRLIGLVTIPWPGVDHGDFTVNGRDLLMSTEYSGMVVKIDTVAMKLVGSVRVGGEPIDIKSSPDGKVFYVANQGLNGVTLLNPRRMRIIGFIRTGRGAHGLAVSRNGKLLYVANRYEGSISVISFAKRHEVATWQVGGSPDMLQVSPDGTQLWTSNRFDGSVSAISTRDGHVIRVIRTGIKPHGLTYFPQPGRYCIGHNGVYR